MAEKEFDKNKNSSNFLGNKFLTAISNCLLRDQEQQQNQSEENGQQCVDFNSNYFADLIFNYLMILLMFSGYVAVNVLNR